jgi:methylmalonyl-CoA/ethylmalonyl-CoA epimerase
MPNIKRIDHIAIVVEHIEEALGFWRDTLGLDLSHIEDVPDQHSIVAFLPTGASEVELVKPTSDETGIARYLQKRGPGLHHICFEVDDIEAMLGQLREKNVRLINSEPMVGTGGKKIAFIHPESTNGVLLELYELTPQEPEIRRRRVRRFARRAVNGSINLGSTALSHLRNRIPDVFRDESPEPETVSEVIER